MTLLNRLVNSQRNREFNSGNIQNFFSDIDLSNFKKKRILEVGCGNGYVGIEIKKIYNSEVFSCDLLEPENSNLKNEVKFVKGDISYLDLKDFGNKGFDLIFSYRMFLHLPAIEKIKIISNLYYNFLKPGGILLIDFAGNVEEEKYFEISKEDNLIIDEIKKDNNIGLNLIQINKKYFFEKDLALLDKNLSDIEKEKIIRGDFDKFKFESITLMIIKK